MGAVMGAGRVKFSGIWKPKTQDVFLKSSLIHVGYEQADDLQTHLLLFGSSVECGRIVPAVLRSCGGTEEIISFWISIGGNAWSNLLDL